MIRVGFLGCGLIARHHGDGLRDVPDATIGLVHDVDSARARAFAAHVAASAVSSGDAVIEASDAVYVCTWTAAHRELVEAVAAAGKHVFCEKPLATELADARAMTEAVERAGIVNQTGLILRRSPSFRWLKQSLNGGPIMNLVFRDDQYLPTQGLYGSTWRGDASLAGSGTLLEHSIHDLDLIDWLMGPIVSVSAVTHEHHGLVGIEESATVTLVAESGAQATLVSVWHDVLSRPSQRRVEIFTTDAVLTLEGDWHGPVSVERSDRAGHPNRQRLEGTELEGQLRDGLGTNPDAAFIESIVRRTDASPSFRVALRAHELADAAYRSAASGGAAVSVRPTSSTLRPGNPAAS